MQVRLANTGSAPPHFGTSARPKADNAVTRDPKHVRVRSRPLFETSSTFVRDLIPAWPESQQLRAEMSARSVSDNDLRQPLPSPQCGSQAESAAQRQPGQADGLSLEALRRTLRSEEERRILRERQLRELGLLAPKANAGKVCKI